ncbi:helix-turn-helix transcriptional regulator [Natrinema ejinorense]|uniref:DUF4897 domain-containing protein n=1 Tax=Natrinema ejinorense TaxID=373386 RepID=A0A2A5QXS0_9EURY|nr:hypothetical protein [Natrinema ejinorense]PCR91617.1 hypothetical protein CP557_14440 [Natrinema ejinorense]
MDVWGLRALVCVLVVVGCSVAFVTAPGVAGADAGTQSAAFQEDADQSLELEDADRIHIDVFIAENGTANVAVDYQFHLDDGNSSPAEWERLREDIESNPETYTAAERAKWNETLAEGENRTDREMNLSNVSITTETNSAPREVGHAVVTFQWSNFALVVWKQIEAGAALAGLTLDDGTELQFHWPEGYTVYQNGGERQIDPPPSEPLDGSAIWRGESTSFTENQPRITLVESGNTTSESEPTDRGPAMPWTIVVLALALLATVGTVGWLVGRNRTDTVSDDGSGPPQWTDGATASRSDSSGGPPPELLSNEERVLRLLEEHGGRIKQQAVVSELEWTEAKTSQVVGELRENDEIEVFRIGRENVLALPDEE